MITFWLICGLFVVIALAFVLPPLWQPEPQTLDDETDTQEANVSIYRSQLAELRTDLANGIIDQQQYEQDRDEIERRLLEDVPQENKESRAANPKATETRTAAYAIAILLPALAVGIYLRVGNSNARPPATTESPSTAARAGADGMSSAQIEANVEALAKRLESDPNNASGWTMLARSYANLRKYDLAIKAYERAIALKPADANLLTDYAFVLATANGSKFEGRPSELIQKALQLDPDNVNALGLAGGIAFEQKDYKRAIEYWNRVITRLPPDSDLAQAIKERLAEAKERAGGGSSR